MDWLSFSTLIDGVLGESDIAVDLKKMIHSAFDNASYGEGMRRFVNSLFGRFGLVVIEPGVKAFKQLMEKDLKYSH